MLLEICKGCFAIICNIISWFHKGSSDPTEEKGVKIMEIRPGSIAFDIDGVVTDTMGSFIKVAREQFGIDEMRKEDITSYWIEECLPLPEEIIQEIISRILNDPWGTGLTFIPGARDLLIRLGEVSRLTFVTARPFKEPIEEWLVQGLGNSDIEVIATGAHDAKGQVLLELRRDYFVEDHLETCRELYEQGIKAMVFDQPWNRNGKAPFRRVRNWQEIAKVLSI